MRKGNGKMQIGQRTFSVGRQAECTAAAACLVLLALAPTSFSQSPISFDDIKFWVGSGTNRAALVIDWVENTPEPPALAWGYRWDGTARGSDMLTEIVAADSRLFAKLGGTPSNPNSLFGLGYDADGDGQFALDDGTSFNGDGIAFTNPADLAASADSDDYYAEGWFTGFWHYGVESPAGSNPYDGSDWSDIPVGMASRALVDGAWDSWAFSPTFDFAAYADNPQAAPSPFQPGDFNEDGRVEFGDYDVWQANFGSTSKLAADGSGNGTIDAADYVVWRDHFHDESTIASIHGEYGVPEPRAVSLIAALAVPFHIHRKERI
jgi:hypothetical protein